MHKLNSKSCYVNAKKINEECGCFGIYNVENAASMTYFGLHALQHRGQQACGIASSDNSNILCIKNQGLLTEVFNATVIDKLIGSNAVGHVRYATQSENIIENVQPLMCRAHQGEFAVVHNGQIVNSQELRFELEQNGSIFQSTSDSEIISHLIQKAEGKMIDKIKAAANMLQGAFAFIIMTKDCMYGIRDNNGLRPLSVGKIGEGYCVTSETCAFDIVNAKFLFDVMPGEIIKITPDGVEHVQYTTNTQHKMCAMEYIYFARPDSDIDQINVHTARRNSGRILARNDEVVADIVIGVPDSSLSAAQGYSEMSKLPYELGLIKNRYVGRTFIQPTQKQRENGVRMKLSAVSSIVKNKKIVMVDDSIVRGTTSKRIVQLLKDAGASEVHVRIASSPLISPCFYGVDTSTYDELISARLNVDELCEFIGADSLKFLEVDEMFEGNYTNNLCVACFNEVYPTQLYSLGKILKK